MHSQKKRWPAPMSTLATTLARVLGLLALMSAVAPAAGADSLTCTIDDRTLRLELVGTTNMSGDTRVYVRSGQLTLKPSAFSNEPIEIPIMQSNLILQWILGRTLRFAIHLRHGHRGETFFVTILASRATHSAIYHGSYLLKLMCSHESRSVSGRIQGCVAD